MYRTNPIFIHKVRGHTGVADNTAADKFAGLEYDLLINPDNIFANVSTTSRATTWMQYAIEITGSLTLAQPASAYKDVDTL